QIRMLDGDRGRRRLIGCEINLDQYILNEYSSLEGMFTKAPSLVAGRNTIFRVAAMAWSSRPNPSPFTTSTTLIVPSDWYLIESTIMPCALASRPALV